MFEQATKERTHLRLAIFGPSGGGKTFTSLRIATGMGGGIAFIDTERRSARKYSDRFKFKVCDLDNRTIAGYVDAIKNAAKIGANVLIIDSLSHAWEELLNDVDRIAKSKYSGNKWSAWSEGTPKQNQLIDTLLSFPGHIIATMRTDTEWATEKDERTGKMRPIKLGLKPRQGKHIEYEFDMLMELSPEHIATITKDRTGKFQDEPIEKPDEEFGKKLAAWLNDGAVREQPKESQNTIELKALVEKHDIPDTTVMEWLAKFEARKIGDIADENIARIISAVKKKYETKLETTAA